MDRLDQILQLIRTFRDERDWMQFHNPKNLACSVSIEAAELLEHFQWTTPEQSLEVAATKKTEIAHEIADVAVYLIELADNLGIDLAEAVSVKMKLNAEKYPVDKVRSSAKKYNEYLGAEDMSG